MLAALSSLLKARGQLSGLIIDEAEGLPSSSAYQHRFGSLLRAYEFVGFTPDRDYGYVETNRALRRMHPDIVVSVIAGIEAAGGSVVQDRETDLLKVNDELLLSIIVVRRAETSAGSARWHLRLDAGLVPDLTVAVRMAEGNLVPLDYYILPGMDMTESRIRFAQHNEGGLEAYRFDDLGALYDLTGRVPLKEVA